MSARQSLASDARFDLAATIFPMVIGAPGGRDGFEHDIRTASDGRDAVHPDIDVKQFAFGRDLGRASHQNGRHSLRCAPVRHNESPFSPKTRDADMVTNAAPCTFPTPAEKTFGKSSANHTGECVDGEMAQ